MKINNREVSIVEFVTHDALTNQKFGCKKDFNDKSYSNHFDFRSASDLPDKIYFSNTTELRKTIELLTNMYNLVEKHRDEQEQIRERMKRELG